MMNSQESTEGAGGTIEEDADLVRLALDGGPADFEPIVQRHRGAVVAVAIARTGDFDDAEDIAQLVFLEAYQRLDRLRDPERLGPWLRSIAIHRSINHVRQGRRGSEIEDIHGPTPAELPPPDRAVEQEEERRMVLAAISRLGKTQRETVTLYYLGGYTQSEVARIQEVPVGTIKFRLHEARKRMRHEMAGRIGGALQKQGPGPSFTKRVIQLLDARQGGGAMFRAGLRDELRGIGADGADGFRQVMSLSDYRSRRAAVHYSGALPIEEAIELLRRAALDPNRKVRNAAVAHLLGALDVDEDTRREHLVPAVTPLLRDRSWKVRYRAASFLATADWAKVVPLETASEALAEEQHPRTIPKMRQLVLAVLAVKGARTR